MNVPFVDLKAQYESLQSELDGAIQSVIAETAFVGGRNNRFVNKFEVAFASYLGIRNVVGCANGTDAIEMVLEALGVGPGDEVIVPAMTWISTAAAVRRAGAAPVFVDIDPRSYTLNPDHLRSAIGSSTKVVIPVHLYGRVANMSAIMEIAREQGIRVIEDAAQAHGALQDGKRAGTFGDAAIFSFYPGKNLGAFGDAGCVVTNDDDLAEEIRRIGNHGQVSKHDHRRLGRNSRLDGLAAAVLSVKLGYLDHWNEGRRAVAAFYDEALRETALSLQESLPDQRAEEHVHHLFVVRAESEAQRDELSAGLKARGVATGFHYPSILPSLPFLADLDLGECRKRFPVSSSIAEVGLSLPIYPELADEQMHYVALSVQKILSGGAALHR